MVPMVIQYNQHIELKASGRTVTGDLVVRLIRKFCSKSFYDIHILQAVSQTSRELDPAQNVLASNDA